MQQFAILTAAVFLATACIMKDRRAQTKFIMGGRGNQLKGIKLLIQRVHEPQWQIGYRYGIECKPEERQNGKALREAISTSLRTWLKPLKDLKLARPIVDKFVYELQADFNPINPEDRHNPNEPEDLEGWQRVDLRVTFQCRKQITSFILRGGRFQPAIVMRRGTETTPGMLALLNHEIGHAFGLADTYARPGIMHSRGGLSATAGIQPASMMAMPSSFQGNKADDAPLSIGEDDVRGIVWFYKHFHENHAVDNCFFADYTYVEELTACRPKHPLIFEAKHNHSIYALQILKDDPDLDINAQDVSGMTALHYAVMYEKVEVVRALLAHEDIKPLLKNKQGETPLDIAQAIKNNAIVRLFPKQEEIKPPPPLNVAPKNKVITTWGAIKAR